MMIQYILHLAENPQIRLYKLQGTLLGISYGALTLCAAVLSTTFSVMLNITAVSIVRELMHRTGTLRCSKARHPVRSRAAGGPTIDRWLAAWPSRQLLWCDTTIRSADLQHTDGDNFLDIKCVSLVCNIVCSKVFSLTNTLQVTAETAQTLQHSVRLVRFQPKSTGLNRL